MCIRDSKRVVARGGPVVEVGPCGRGGVSVGSAENVILITTVMVERGDNNRAGSVAGIIGNRPADPEPDPAGCE